jgi:peptidoglycan/xylan/chitin deacetylase (PgdA/CDA1 family)
MKGKGVIVLVVILFFLFSVSLLIDYDNTPLATIFAPSIPTQIYSPTEPTPDQKVVCIVFDDGWKSQLSAVPVLQSYGFNATFAIVTSYSSYPDYMSWKDIRGLATGGMDIASHTVTHPDLDTLDSAALYNELSESQQTLRSRGYPANGFVYPYGDAAGNKRFATPSHSTIWWQGG